MAWRQEKAEGLIRDIAAEFLERESNQRSLITVTRASVSPDLKRATFYITVLPEEMEEHALDFAKRKRKELREFLKTRVKSRTLPFLDVEIDKAEKTRQRLEELKNDKA